LIDVNVARCFSPRAEPEPPSPSEALRLKHAATLGFQSVKSDSNQNHMAPSQLIFKG